MSATLSPQLEIELAARAFVAALLLAVLIGILGCSIAPWHYVGPNMSERTAGPIIVNSEQMQSACNGIDALGCMDQVKNAIYLKPYADRNYRRGYCGLPKHLPRTTEEHEWCHAVGWQHD